MKMNMLKSFVLSWLCLINISAFADERPRDCGESCFQSEVVSVTETDSGCLSYTLQITNDGSCSHALSHYTVGIPACAVVSDLSNSGGWKQEVGIADPKTGLYGFKIDDISDFGEDGEAGEFTVEFIICPDNEGCEDDLNCWAPEVAYKAGQCIYYEQTELSCQPLAARLDTQDVTCFGGSDGNIAVTVEEGEPPYNYEWSDGTTGSANTNLKAGNYSVVITDATGQSISLTATIEQPDAMSADISTTPATCSGQSNGSVSVEAVSGGTPPYTYLWSTGATTSHLQNASSGDYELNITDSLGCSVMIPVVIENDTEIAITADIEETGCNDNGGSITLTVDGGTAPYTYEWSTGETSNALTDLGAGFYQVEVTDANGCFASGSYILEAADAIQLHATTTETGCIEDNSGSIDLAVAGGVAPYIYLWSNGMTSEDIENLPMGTYTVTVTDQRGCEASATASITADTYLVTSSTNNPSCTGANDGYIQLAPLGGTAPYTYLWSNGATTAEADSLTAGSYEVTVADASGCPRNLSFNLEDPEGMIISVEVDNQFCIEGEFSIDLSVSGGVEPYSILWEDGITTEDRDFMTTGDYMVEVTDANGCSISKEVFVGADAAGCEGVSDPESGGSGDYEWAEGPSEATGSEVGGNNTADTPGDGGDGDYGDGEMDYGDSDFGDNSDDGDYGDNDSEGCYNPFSTRMELIAIEGNCLTYRAEVAYNGNHTYGLSHFDIATTCGQAGDIDNSGNWAIEIDADPTTGLSVIKIDDISNFGEDDLSEDFTVDFTVCTTDDDCVDALMEGEFTVGYKYGKCVSYSTVTAEGMGMEAEVNVYPNPFRVSTTIEFSGRSDGLTTVDIYNQRGVKVEQLYQGITKKGVKYFFTLDGTNLPNDIYTYKITTATEVFRGTIMLTH